MTPFTPEKTYNLTLEANATATQRVLPSPRSGARSLLATLEGDNPSVSLAFGKDAAAAIAALSTKWARILPGSQFIFTVTDDEPFVAAIATSAAKIELAVGIGD